MVQGENMQIHKIIKQAIKRLEREGKSLTPDFYAEAFCKEAKVAGVKVGDCEHVNKLMETLSPALKKEIKNYRIQTLSELTRFLIAKINRTDPTKCTKQLEAQIALNKAILKAISKLHNLKAKELAKKSITMLNENPTPTEIDHFKQLWENFVATYDDTFLEKLKPYGKVYTDDLEKTIQNLKIANEEIQNNFNIEKATSILIHSLTPSIASDINDDIKEFIEKLKENPELLIEESIEEQVKQVVQARIALDKENVKEMVASLEGILDKLSERLINMIEQSDGSTGEIQRIKKELESFTKQSEINFQNTHKQLYTIAIALEENTVGFKQNLEEHQCDVNALQERVKELEAELKKVQEEAKTDFLTKLYNKRAIEEFFAIKEGEYKRYNRNYSVVMFDLDHFKKVNDTYGHEAGDVVLKAFATILKRSSRDVDIVGRFGGEEFIVLLSDTDKEGAYIYAEKVRKHVQTAKFMYKDKRIPVTLSAGVAQRSEYPSMLATIEAADANLYKAKRSGRNQVAK